MSYFPSSTSFSNFPPPAPNHTFSIALDNPNVYIRVHNSYQVQQKMRKMQCYKTRDERGLPIWRKNDSAKRVLSRKMSRFLFYSLSIFVNLVRLRNKCRSRDVHLIRLNILYKDVPCVIDMRRARADCRALTTPIRLFPLCRPRRRFSFIARFSFG